MKLKWVAILIAIATIIGGCQKKPAETATPAPSMETTTQSKKQYQDILIGEWQGIDQENQHGGFEFHHDGKAVIIANGKRYHSGAANENWTLMYQLDLKQSPVHLDFLVVNADGEIKKKMAAIINFVEEDEILIRTFFNEVRPVDFLESGTTEEEQSTIVLLKQSPS